MFYYYILRSSLFLLEITYLCFKFKNLTNRCLEREGISFLQKQLLCGTLHALNNHSVFQFRKVFYNFPRLLMNYTFQPCLLLVALLIDSLHALNLFSRYTGYIALLVY